MHVNDLKKNRRCEVAIRACFYRLPIDLKERAEREVDFLLLDSGSCIRYEVAHSNKQFRTLILMNFVNDLTDVALSGLVAHLFALYAMNYHRQSAPKGKQWLATDLLSDAMACDWGFLEEVNELRRIRPQKTPPMIKYPGFIFEHSALSHTFSSDIDIIRDVPSDVLNNFKTDNKIWYVDRFSMICSPQRLWEDKIRWLHILTNAYTKEHI